MALPAAGMNVAYVDAGAKTTARQKEDAMKTFKVLLWSGIVFCLMLSFGSCTKKAEEAPKAAKVPVIGVVNYGEHPILDVIVDAFNARLLERGYKEGENIKILWKNVGGDENKAAAATTTLLNSGVDVIMSITTPVSQAVYKQAKGKVPIVFCGVTDPISAGLVSSWQNTPGSGITGTSDRWPYKEQLDLIKQIIPGAKRVGFPYNSGEANSQYALTQVQPLAQERGLEIVAAVATNASEVRRAVESLAAKGVDVIYVSSDNTVMAGFEAVLKVAHERKIPVIVGDSANVERGGLATYSVGYPQLGTATADLVLRVLGGEEPGKIPVQTFQGEELYVNLDAAKKMGITLDPKLIAKAHVVNAVARKAA
jgi:putative ABC transport system substrate-binding protein